MHAVLFYNQGATKVSYIVAGSANANTNTGAAAQWLSQGFTTVALQTTISRIELNLQNVAAGADVTVQIRTNNAGTPSDTVLYSIVLPSDFEPAAATYISIPCNLAGLVAATKYHIVLVGTVSTSNICQWNSAVTSVVQGYTSATGTIAGGWVGAGKTFLFNVFNGTNGVLRNTAEDSSTVVTGGVTSIGNLPLRWTGLDYNTSVAAGNWNPITYREVVGVARSVRTLSYTSGVLSGIA